MLRALLRFAIAVCAAAALSFPAEAQDPPTFGEEMDVRVVNVEVVVTDRDGNRVAGLKPADFRLRVDGKEVPIEYFSEVREGQSVAEAASTEETAAAAGEPGPAPEGRVGTYYLVFVDDYFSIAHHRNAVLKALKADAARLGPEDRMALVAYDGGRLAMLADWSAPGASLERAFDQAMARKTHGFERAKERRSLQGEQQFATTTTADGTLLDHAVLDVGLSLREQAYADTLVRQIRATVGAATAAMRGVAAPQGRKVMLLLSGGWPFSVQSAIRGVPSRETPGGEEIFNRLTGTANRLGYTIYPVDVPGMQTTAADAEAVAVDSGFGSVIEQEVEGSLSFIARETGGRVILNNNRKLALPRVAADTRSYYSLGFSPDWQRDEELHGLKVEVARSGLQLRHRTGFRDLSRRAEVAMKVESALLFGKHPGAVPMPIRLGKLTRTKHGSVLIPVILGLPADVLTAQPAGGGYTAQVELHFAASDANGNSSDFPVQPVSLASAAAPEPGKFIRYDTTILLRGRANHLVVTAYDRLSGIVATAEAEIAER